MNRWDNTFWMLFVLLETVIVIGSLVMFSSLGVIMGFVVVAAGFSKVSDHVHHKKARSEMTEHKETVKRVTNWLNRQYELTQGIKKLHDHRFHKAEGKRSELGENIEKRYRELAGKIIDLENKLNVVSKVTLSSIPLKAAKESVESGFEAVWQDIVNFSKKKKSIETLSRGIKNMIMSVGKDSIVLRSEMTKMERAVTKEEFRHFWEILKRKGSLEFLKDIEDPKLLRAGSIVVSFLARLPRVEYELKPRVLYLMGEDTHSLGTLKVYAK